MDFHFLIRNGIVGFIFLIFFVLGVSVLNQDLAVQLGKTGKDYANLLTFGALPLFGIAIQSLLIMWQAWARGRLFADEARHIVAGKLRDMVRAESATVQQVKQELHDLRVRGVTPTGSYVVDRFLDQDKSDPIFVALYHLRTGIHLIDWARRRRSYYYLGVTGILAAVLGIVCGTLLGLGVNDWKMPDNAWLAKAINTWPQQRWRFLVAVPGALMLVAYAVAVAKLAVRMKEDADEMELAWALMERTNVHLALRLYGKEASQGGTAGAGDQGPGGPGQGE